MPPPSSSPLPLLLPARSLSSQTCLLVWRFIFLILMLHSFIYHYAIFKIHPFAQLHFLTIWGQYLTLTLSIILLSISLYYRKQLSSPSSSDPVFSKRETCCLKFTQILYELTISLEGAITIIFWVVLRGWFDTPAENYSNIWIHGLYLVLVILDFSFCQMQVLPKHWWITVVVSVIYLILNLIVSLAHEPVYGDILNYTNAISYIVILMTLAVLMAVYFTFYGFSICKRKHIERAQRVHKKVNHSQSAKEEIKGTGVAEV